MDEREEQAGGSASEQRAEDGDGRVGPVAAGLTRDGQKGVGDAGAEVTDGVDGVAGGAAEGETERPDDAGDEIGAESGGGAGGEDEARAGGPDDEDQDEGREELREEVRGEVADGGAGAEDTAFGFGVFGQRPEGQVEEPGEGGSANGAGELGGGEGQEGVEVMVLDREGEGDGGVEGGRRGCRRGRR